MNTAVVYGRFEDARYNFYVWSRGSAFAKRLALAGGMAVVTGLLALIRIQLPFTPVPVTGQTMGVLLSGIVCGPVFGALSQLMYVGAGIAGTPWFAGGASGSAAYLLGPTGGYLIGFILAPIVSGYLSDISAANRKLIPQFVIMAASIAVIYLCGAIYLSALMNYGFTETLAKGVLPFVPGGIVKIIGAGAIGSLILPKKEKT
ncbi:MAG: biotin transporter BioY [Candidatus Omnitrophota bacterium]|nr:biotin transporter BioY [Candidatus Omnitrophota bacterium]MBU2528536.1 biotin transporter BioY [bacterium]MBU3929870.1 biotin transporter BioY [bacterium]MBU4122215.1 biotin transporter BioY [bacterium]